jgi:ribosomal protein S12 methylthiotransferase
MSQGKADFDVAIIGGGPAGLMAAEVLAQGGANVTVYDRMPSLARKFLLDWLREAELARVGCFRYEPVAGAPANDLAAPVADDVKDQRWHRFMARQQSISAGKLRKKVGSRIQVIVDESNGRTAKGRSAADAPEIDGSVHLTGRLPIRAGDIVTARVDRADAYDLHAQVA